MDEYKVDSFGEAHLIVDKKGYRRGITCTGVIKAIEKKFILFLDNDGFLYLVEKKDFQFTELEPIKK